MAKSRGTSFETLRRLPPPPDHPHLATAAPGFRQQGLFSGAGEMPMRKDQGIDPSANHSLIAHDTLQVDAALTGSKQAHNPILRAKAGPIGRRRV